MTETTSEEFKTQYGINVDALFDEFIESDNVESTVLRPTTVNTPEKHGADPHTKEFIDLTTSDVEMFIAN